MYKKLTVTEMAKYLNVSKEVVHNRLRRGTLKAVSEHGKKFVLLNSTIATQNRSSNKTESDEYIEFLKALIVELKLKNEKLEDEKDRLYLEKQNILIDSKLTIEKFYKQRDEELKSILSLANIPTLGEKIESNETIKPIEAIEEVEEVEIEEDIVDQMCSVLDDWELLKDRLEAEGFTDQTRRKITKEVKKQIGKSLYVKMRESEIYIKKDTKLKKIIGQS